MRKRGYVGAAIVLTGVIWLFAAMAMLGPMMGDCLPRMGHSCPTDGERRLSLLWIALISAGVNLAAVWLLARRARPPVP
jgi:hypothetical protein